MKITLIPERCIACGLCQTYSDLFDYHDNGIVRFYDDPNLLVYYPMNGKKLDRESGNTVVEDETKIWDWSKNQKHLNLPSGAKFMNDANGQPFVFPLQK